MEPFGPGYDIQPVLSATSRRKPPRFDEAEEARSFVPTEGLSGHSPRRLQLQLFLAAMG
jgi:hypothetical protein